LPGRYYLEVVERLYLRTSFPAGTFTALGRRIDLASVKAPIYLLRRATIRWLHPLRPWRFGIWSEPGQPQFNALAPGEHLGLFMGRRTLANEWREIGSWLEQPDGALFDAA
jgi:Poly(3-hydroxyalkanoate) synthetase